MKRLASSLMPALAYACATIGGGRQLTATEHKDLPVKRFCGMSIATALVAMLLAVAAKAGTGPCLPSMAVADIDNFEFHFQADSAQRSQANLRTMSALISRAADPSKSRYTQLSAKEQRDFDDARHSNIAEEYALTVVSDYVRDVHLMAELIDVAEIDDLYGFGPDGGLKDGPRKFPMTVLTGLRAMLADPPAVPTTKPENGCVMHTAIAMLEGFNVEQIGKHPSEATMQFIADLRRIDVLLDVSSHALELGLADANKITWNGDTPVLTLRYDQWLITQKQSVQMVGKKVVPVINSLLPSKYSYHLAHLARDAAKAQADSPALKK